MFFYLNKNKIIQLILALGLIGWTIFSIVTTMTLLPPDHQAFLYQTIHPWLANHLWSYKLLAILFVVLSALFIQRSFHISKFSDNVTYMPIVFFLLLLNLNHSFSLFSPALFTILTASFLIMMNAQNEHDPSIRNKIFGSGLILGINTLIDCNSIWLLVLMMLILRTTSISKLKETLILLIGFLFIYIYLFTYGYVTDTMDSITNGFQQIEFFGLIHHFSSLQWLDWLLLLILSLTIFVFAFAGKIYFDSKVVALRRRYISFLLLILSMVIIALFSPYDLRHALPYLLMPTSLLFALIALIEERKWLHDIFIIATCVLLWL